MYSETANINIDDTALVEQCRQGDSEAMERLILKYQNRIYNVILKICANTDDAAELTQDTFVKVIENIDGFEHRSSFYTWLFRIGVNLTINHCKRKVKLGFRSLDAENVIDGQGAAASLKELLSNSEAVEPAVVAENKELCELIIRAIMKLNDEQRTVVVLRDIEAMSYAQIAETLGIEPGTVKSRLSRARANLRQFLEVIAK